MLLDYFIGHYETHLYRLVTTKLIQVFIKYDENQVYGFERIFILFYFILFRYVVFLCDICLTSSFYDFV